MLPAEEYEQRRQEEREAAAASPVSDAPLPLFVMSLLLPGVHMEAVRWAGCWCMFAENTVKLAGLYSFLPPTPDLRLCPPNPLPAQLNLALPLQARRWL